MHSDFSQCLEQRQKNETLAYPILSLDRYLIIQLLNNFQKIISEVHDLLNLYKVEMQNWYLYCIILP